MAYAKKHGMWNHRFYHRFYNVLSRCNNPNTPWFEGYGGRGIRCEWASFEDFKSDMYESYLIHVATHGEKQTTLERIDNSGNYSKINCRWATHATQARNKRNNKFITYKGETLCTADWNKRFGLRPGTIRNRYQRCGWSFEDAIKPELRRRVK